MVLYSQYIKLYIWRQQAAGHRAVRNKKQNSHKRDFSYDKASLTRYGETF
jgi:hypothetical protein